VINLVNEEIISKQRTYIAAELPNHPCVRSIFIQAVKLNFHHDRKIEQLLF